jgi:Lrp/AsnC family transcriptional regulator for asnA, asnC and gidA
MAESSIDKVDARIIALLQQDGRMPYIKIARSLGMSETTVRTRVQRLVDDRIVQIVAVGDPFKLGFGIVGTFKIQIDPKKVASVIQELKKIKEIWYIALATGSEHIDTEFNSTSLEDLRVLLYEKLNTIDGILKIDTSILMSYEKRDYTWGTGKENGKGAVPKFGKQ